MVAENSLGFFFFAMLAAQGVSASLSIEKMETVTLRAQIETTARGDGEYSMMLCVIITLKTVVQSRICSSQYAGLLLLLPIAP